MSFRAWLLLLACVFVLGGVAQAAPTASAPGWDYEVRFEEGLSRAHIRLCFRRFVPKRLVLGHDDAHDALELTPIEGFASLRRLDDGESYAPVGLEPGGCIAWSVDLERLTGQGRWRRPADRVGQDLLVTPGALLLRPALWTEGVLASIRFQMPEGLREAVPWPRTHDGEGYVLDRHALRLESKIAFGRFTLEPLPVPGAVIDVAVLDAPHRATAAGIRAWIQRAAEAVALLYRTFPAPRLLALVYAVPSRGESVLFGTAMRGGGAHITLMLSSTARDEELVGEWVGVHEMTHLGMPWTFDSDAWFQEGFVTYYQEMLRARAGLRTEQETWQNLHEGFGRGLRSGGERTLSAESREMHRHHTYHRVYWGGAAIALLMDVELRRRFPGRWCLDDLMQFWRRMHGGTAHGAATAEALMRAADRRLGQALCVPLSDRYLGSATFPDLAALYAELGVRVVDGKVVLDDGAPQASLRRALTARPAAVTSGR